MFKNNSFISHIATLTKGTALAQAIPILLSPLLTRMYTPEDFGLFALFVSLVTIFSVFATGMYEMAIVLPKKSKDALLLRNISILITIFITLMLFFIGTVFYDLIITILPENMDYDIFLILIPLSVFLIGVYQSTILWFNRYKYYKIMSKTGVIQSITTTFFQVLFAVLNLNYLGLIVGRFLGQLISTLFLLKNYKLKEKIFYRKKENKVKYFALLKRYKKFPYFETWSKLFDISSNEIPAILILILFSPKLAGFYIIATRVLSLPIIVLATSTSHVFFQKISEVKKSISKLQYLSYTTFKKLILIGVVPISLVIVWGDILFQFVFGDAWDVSGEIAQILALMIFVNFISFHLNNILIVLEEQNKSLYFNSIQFITKLSSIVLGYMFFNDIYITLIIYVVFSIFIKLFWMKYIFNKLNIRFSNVLFEMSKFFVPLLGYFVFLRMAFS